MAKSEFGRGFIYNFFLFAKHFERIKEQRDMYESMRGRITAKDRKKGMFSDNRAVEMWFYGAADHLLDLEIPVAWENEKIGKIANKLQKLAYLYRMPFSGHSPSMEDFTKFFDLTEKLMMLIDKKLGVKVRKAEWN